MSIPQPHLEPATPFWDGYKRDPAVTERFIAALRSALYAHPSLRAGQVLGAVLHRTSTTIFSLYDEDFIDALEEFARKV